MNNEIHVVINRLDLSDDYNRHAGATMASVLENCSRPVIFHITHDGNKSFKNMSETNANIAKYQELVSKYGSRVEFHDLDKFEWDKRLPKNILQKWPSICLSRLHFQDIFPQLNKIILLGVDVIVMTDLATLWDNMHDEDSIGAVHDMGLWLLSPTIADTTTGKANPDISKYINADVVIFNLRKIRIDNELIKKAIEYLSICPNPQCYEQDVLNYVFRGEIHYLPQKFNLIPSEINKDTSEYFSDTTYPGFIVHFAGAYKPWSSNYNPKIYSNYFPLYYWHALSLSPFNTGKAIEEIIWDYLPKPGDVIHDIDKYIWTYRLHDKIRIIWELTIPLWMKLLRHYIHK